MAALVPMRNAAKSDSSLSRDEVKSLKAAFDETFYAKTYQHHLSRHAKRGENAFDFYLRRGARLGHDPNPVFSEVLYRRQNADIAKAILEGRLPFGHAHWRRIGMYETTRKHPGADTIAAVRQIVATLDLDFLEEAHPLASELFISPADFYFDRAAALKLSPSPLFSEEGYLSLHGDVAELVAKGGLVSGYAHYLKTGMKEGRASRTVADHHRVAEEEARSEADETRRHILERNLPGVTRPVGLDAVTAIEYLSDPIAVTVEADRKGPEILVLVPNFLPEILFGGYMAFFDFLTAVKASTSATVRLLVVNRGATDTHAGNVLRMRMDAPKVADLFASVGVLPPDRTVTIAPDTTVVSYCADLHRMAGRIAATLGRKPIFFIQEYEPDFHANTDMRAFIRSAFQTPHLAVYNSAMLQAHFETRSGLVGPESPSASATLENALKRPTKTQLDRISSKSDTARRRLVFYARPEGHAARNMFATFVLGLKRALKQGVFDGHPWEFIGLGSLAFQGDVPLGDRHVLDVRAKLPKAEYEDFLLTGDIGASFISTPHPGIIHFQMAAFGLPTLTNTTELRTEAWLKEQSGNLIGVDLTVEAIADGLALAVDRAEDVAARKASALAGVVPDAETAMAAAVDFVAKEVRRPTVTKTGGGRPK